MAKEKQAGFCVFENSRDIQLMQEFRDYYQHAFQGKTDIEQAHQNLPELLSLDTQEEEGSKWIPWSSNKKFGHLPKKISPSMLQLKHFVDATENYSDSINYEVSKNLISAGMRYIEAIEKNPLRRRTWHPYSHIDRPDYYLIVAVSERVRVLWKSESSHALFQEYHCLEEFIDSLTRIAANYFQALPLQKSEPFHYYLNNACGAIRQLKANVLFELDKRAIADWLGKIAKNLESYRCELATYLACCISNARLSENLSLDQIEDGKQLPADFIKSPIYHNLHGLLYQRPFCGIRQITIKDHGVSDLLVTFNKRNPAAVNAILAACNQLFHALDLLFSLIASIRFLAENAQSEGEGKMAHDKTLSLILKTNRKLISAFLKQCHDKITIINTRNPESLKGHEYFVAGPQKNMQQAIRNSKVLQGFAEKIEKKQQYIEDKIRKIKKASTGKSAVKHNDLLTKTEQLLTVAKENAIIPVTESAGLLETLQRRSRPAGSVQGAPASVDHHISESKDNPNFQEDNVQEKIHQFEQQAEQAMDGAPSVNPFPFPDIYALIGDNADARARFNNLTQGLHHEIDQVLPALIQQLQAVHDLRQQLENQLRTFCEKQRHQQNEDSLRAIKQLLSELSELISKTQYADTVFGNFKEIEESIIALYNQKETQWYAEIETLLSDFITEYPDNDAPLSLLAVHMIPVKNHMLERIQPVMTSFDRFKSNVTQAGFPLDLDIIQHYEERIAVEEKKLRGLGENGFAGQQFSTEPAISTQPPDLPHAGQNTTVTVQEFNKNASAGSLQELENICILLFTADANVDSLKASLLLLYQHLRHAEYELFYFGGKALKDNSDDKFPHHIAEMLDYHQKEINNIRDKAGAEKLRNDLFDIARKALDNNGSINFFGYRFFATRYHSTQIRYEKMSSFSGANASF